jgi:inorganic triphosphatase YgiF
MQEIELKLVVPDAARAAVEHALQAGRRASASTLPEQHLAAAYYDTLDRRLAHAGMALRVRKEGTRWVQTLKAGGPNAMERLEHNVPLRVPRGTHPTADPQRHAGTPAGDALAAALATRDGEAQAPELVELYRTDIRRRTRTLRAPGGTLELAFDEGWIVAADRRLPVCELEIELVRGTPQAVIEQARRWVREHGLWLDVHTKAHRGDHLARGADPAPASAVFPPLPPNATLDAAWRHVHTALLDALLDNASALSSDRAQPEHVRALRVGLRRLRSTWKLFAPYDLALNPDTQAAAITLFRELGQVRDADTLVSLWPTLHAAGCPELTMPSQASGLAAPDLLRTPAVSLLWLDLLEAVSATPSADATADRPAAALIGERLRRWHRRATKEAKSGELNDAALHELRKRLKRLRDGIELGLAFLPAKAAKRHLTVLREALGALGAFNDLCVARRQFESTLEHEPRAWFAVGWLAAQHAGTLQAAEDAVKRWRRAPAFWR